ncbi:MAG: exodeoxyribonuclease V subunit gamma, partial [Verrucomicrobiia bacterium]
MTEKELYLHTSNRIESLAERLVQVSRTQPLDSLLSQETVMTLNPGMARWLRFQIAQSQGVAFGWEFPFPGSLFERILSGFDRSHAQSGLFDENLARWELFDLLGT